MARWRQWYEEVMDVALRATLKEHGFRRKSPSTYICDRSPDRVWAFEIRMGKWGGPAFNVDSGIRVPAIAEILKRVAPEFT